jgi:hypothetical protein
MFKLQLVQLLHPTFDADTAIANGVIHVACFSRRVKCDSVKLDRTTRPDRILARLAANSLHRLNAFGAHDSARLHTAIAEKLLWIGHFGKTRFTHRYKSRRTHFSLCVLLFQTHRTTRLKERNQDGLVATFRRFCRFSWRRIKISFALRTTSRVLKHKCTGLLSV